MNRRTSWLNPMLLAVVGLCLSAGWLSSVWAGDGRAAIKPPISGVGTSILKPPLIPVTPVGMLTCPAGLPDPLVSVVGTESYTVGGEDFVRYLLSVDNRASYPNALFAPAPDLPPCGANPNASRTWVIILDQDERYVYGFCALSSAEDLDGLWFAVLAGNPPPVAVKVVIWDRLCEKDWQKGYKSASVPIDPSAFSSPPLTDLEIRSGWASTKPVINGVADAAEWSGAGSLPLYDTAGIHRGNLLVKNDSTALYLLLDMIRDPVAGAKSDDDYSGIAFDIGLDGVKSPYVDLKYGCGAGTENLGIQWSVSESGWTGVNPTALSLYREGYGPSSGSSASHKIFEYMINFGEVGIDWDNVLSDLEALYHARVNVKVASDSPGFGVHYPSSQYGSWANPMIRVVLGLPEIAIDPKAPIISGVGLVPRTFINQTSGLATTGTGHAVEVIDAPFGSHLRVIGNQDKLRSLGIQHYAIGYCNMSLHPCASLGSGSFNLNHWKFVDDVRTNYYWNGTLGLYALDNVSPVTVFDSPTLTLKVYPVLSATREWYFPNLLFDWRTTGGVPVNSGLYKIHFLGFSTASLAGFVSTPDWESTLVVRIDNTWPVMRVNSIRYRGAVVDPCALVRLVDADDPLVVNVSAYDPDGFLRDFTLEALYGAGESFTCRVETYTGYLLGGGSRPSWHGAMPSADYLCEGDAGDHWETTCGYTFRVKGWDRAINGYGHIHHNEGHMTITVLMPDFMLP